MSIISFETVQTERPMAGVAVVRLVEPPTVWSRSMVAESVREATDDADVVVLAGPGWRSSGPAREMTATIVADLRGRGVDVSIGRPT